MSRSIITRRALVGAAGAALGAVGLPVTASALASPASDPDAALFDLIAQHAAARAEMERAKRVNDAAFAVFTAAAPPRPDVLRVREDDFPRTGLGVGLSEREGDEFARWYGQRGVAWMRDRPSGAWFPGRINPDAARDEARRLEIIKAWDDHVAAQHAVEVATGYEAANDALDDAADLVCTLAAEVARSRPQTLPGLQALGAWFAGQVAEDDVHDNFLELLAGAVAAFGGVAS